MPKLYGALSEEQANLYSLILSASHLPYTLVNTDEGWDIWVTDTDSQSALEKIAAYHQENPAPFSPDIPCSDQTTARYSGLWVAALLLLIDIAQNYHHAHHAMARLYGADAQRILAGEVNRAVTALMLHSGPVHLVSNMVGIWLFGTAVALITGPGCGWLLILVTGIAGNIATAAFHQTDYLSVGASTAIFGAIGILSTIRSREKPRTTGWKNRPWVPLAAGLGLLGLLGSSGEQTDLRAHAFGLLAGIVLGFGYALWIRTPPAPPYQLVCLLVTLAILIVVWL